MTDFITHFLCSFIITFFAAAITRNIKVALGIGLLCGISKEFFLDGSISPFDLCADLLGVLIAYDVFKKDLKAKY